VVKIMDFGPAKRAEVVRRSTRVIGGTPYYMAPEQSAGEQDDHRVDLNALGVTFFELLTGKVPFKEGDVAFHHRHTPPPNVRDQAPSTPPALAELVAGLLEKRPADRIRSAGEVVRRLAEIARAL
jgi:serine/threonine-protein kinase